MAIISLPACGPTQVFEMTAEPALLPTPVNFPLVREIETPVLTATTIPPVPLPTVNTPMESATSTLTVSSDNGPESPPRPSSVTSTTELEGPLIAYRVQNDESYLLLLDIGTMTFREVARGQIEIGGLNWLDDGCHLFTRGNVIDLHGNIIEKTNDPENGQAHFQVVLLSPDRKVGAVELFQGFHDEIELEYLRLAILDRTKPDLQIELAPNGGAYAYAWSPDGSWLAFTDFDENFILQLYRATPDGRVIEQLTSHSEDPGVIGIITWSPDGQQIAYAAQAILPPQYERGGWIGLVSLPDLHHTAVKPDNYQYTKGLWWDENSNRIVFVGESFSSAPNESAESQLHWADPASGTILNSFYGQQLPSHHFNLVTPVGNVDTIFFGAMDGYYLLDAGTNNYQKIFDEIPIDGLIRDFVASPYTFPGEVNCQP